jgi:hypothetical protein
MELNRMQMPEPQESDREDNAAYARCMAIGTALAMALIVIECVAYVSGALSPYVPLEELPRLWGMSMKEYLLAARVPAGWGWLALAGRGDYVNFIGIALLAGVTVACYLTVFRRYLARRDRVFAALAAAQLLLLLAAASGLLNSIAGG